jgi:hypothetical protein
MPPRTKIVTVAVASMAPIPVPISTTIAVPVTAFVPVAAATFSIPAPIIAIVPTFSALLPVEPTDVTVTIAAIPPSIGIAIVLRQHGVISERVGCTGGAAKCEEGTGGKKDSFHFSVSQ